MFFILRTHNETRILLWYKNVFLSHRAHYFSKSAEVLIDLFQQENREGRGNCKRGTDESKVFEKSDQAQFFLEDKHIEDDFSATLKKKRKT